MFPKEGLTNEGIVDFLKPLGWSARGLKLIVKDGVLNPIAGFGPDSRYFLSSVDPECFRGDPSLLRPPGCRAKITEEQAREVFRMRIAGDPLTKIGDQIGISAACVRQILKGRTWKRVYLEFTSNEKTANRGRGWHGQGTYRRRQGQEFRAVGAGCGDSPPCACGAAGDGTSERIFTMDPWAGNQRHPQSLRGTRHRLRRL
jgi:hypothetical protein